MQSAIDRYLKDNGYLFSILTSREFAVSRSVLEGKARMLRDQGKGKKPNKACSLTVEEEEVLWECGQLGSHSPSSIINTLWWKLTQHFGLRGRQEHHGMKLEDFMLKLADGGKEYLTFSEGITKTRQSGLHEKQRLITPKMFATGTPRCPVSLFKMYINKRPVHLRKTGPFYLSVIGNPNSPIWFKLTPMGVNKINHIMKKMIENSPLSGIPKKITNHSARKTVVKKLKQQQVPKSDIISITGHNNERGLDAYDSGDEHHQQILSNCIENIPSNNLVSTAPKNPHQWYRNTYVSPNNPLIQHPTFDFFPRVQPQVNPTYTFNNCTVHFNNATQSQNNLLLSPTQKRRRIRIISSSESSQEQ